MMKFNIQAIVNTFLIICLSFFSTNVKASFWIECEGMVTIKSIMPEKEALFLSVDSEHINADIQVHNHTFTCTGHSKEIDSYGKRKNAVIVLPFTINKTLIKKGTNLRVKLDYGDWMGPNGGGSATTWTALKIIEAIPTNKILAKKQALAKARSAKKGTQELNNNDVSNSKKAHRQMKRS